MTDDVKLISAKYIYLLICPTYVIGCDNVLCRSHTSGSQGKGFGSTRLSVCLLPLISAK